MEKNLNLGSLMARLRLLILSCISLIPVFFSVLLTGFLLRHFFYKLIPLNILIDKPKFLFSMNLFLEIQKV